jgi:hypothetical protein
MRLCLIVSALFVLIAASPVFAEQKISLKTKLTEKTYLGILKALKKMPVKSHWRDVAWRPNFGVAIEEARKADKPILLWVMNGHPCGMT